MENSTISSQVRDLEYLLDRIQYAQHGSTASVRSTLSTATSTLSSALVHITKLLETADNIEQQNHAAESLSEVLNSSIPVLELHLEVFERGPSNSDRARSQSSWSRRRQSREEKNHHREEQRICHSIQGIITQVLSISSLLEIRSTTFPLATELESNYSYNQNWANRRDPTPPRGCRRQRADHGRRVIFQDDPIVELSGCHSFRTELPVPLTADEEPMVIPANIRGGRVVNLSNDDRNVSSDDDILTDNSEDDIPGRFSPAYSPRRPPPPSYTSQHGLFTDTGPEDDDLKADGNEWDHPSESDEAWVNPIIAGCRDVIRERFSTACTSAFDRYDRYRKQTKASPDYEWYLNFRYLSFILQPDLPFQVFLTSLKTYASGSERQHHSMLAYLFEDCIVFANSPFCPDLPDPNVSRTRVEQDKLPETLHNGLLVLEDWPIRFEKLLSLRKEGRNTLIIEVATDTDNYFSDANPGETEVTDEYVRHVLVFQTTCQRHEVFKALLPWLMMNDLADQDHQPDTRTQPQDYVASESPSSSSSSSRPNSIRPARRNPFERPLFSRVQEQGRAAEYTYTSRRFGDPSHDHTAATPRSAPALPDSHVPHPNNSFRSEREFRFGVSRHRSPPGVEMWMFKSRKKHWFWGRRRQSNPVVGGDPEE